LSSSMLQRSLNTCVSSMLITINSFIWETDSMQWPIGRLHSCALVLAWNFRTNRCSNYTSNIVSNANMYSERGMGSQNVGSYMESPPLHIILPITLRYQITSTDPLRALSITMRPSIYTPRSKYPKV
jgi:hypothetical protein